MADWIEDWDAIKTEYLTTKTSYRKLADKYGIHYKTIADRGKEEGWKELRSQHSHNTLTKILECDTEQKVSRAEKLNNAADMLLGKVVALIEASDPMDMDTQAMKHISGVLRDIKEIQGIKSKKDLEEQDARIAKLRKEAQSDEDKDNTPKLVVEGLPEEFKA